jgi:choline dehydrogenase-like flavoprotein
LFSSRAGADVLMLEAGAKHGELGVTARIAGVTVAKYKKALHRRAAVTMTGDPAADLFEELAPGGLSNHWSCAVPRFSREDFADARRAGEPYVWPIDYADVAPWYDAVEPLLQIAGSTEETPQLPRGQVRRAQRLDSRWESVANAALDRHRSVVAMPYAYGAETTLTFTGTPFNSYVRLVRPAMNDGRFSVRFAARALRLEWSSHLKRVAAVVVRDVRTGSEERVSCDGVVLAAGAVNTAQILLESCSGDFPRGLGNHHDVLGRYFHDHPLGKLAIDLPTPVAINPPAYITRRALVGSVPLYAAAGMQWSGIRALLESVRRGHPGTLASVGFSVFGTMVPTADDFVELAPERPRVDGASALNFHVRYPPAVSQVLEEARADIIGVLERGGWEPKQKSWAIEPVGNSVHYAGTCRMHASPQFGMLDAFSRVHGVHNVAVADSSVFTTGPEKNPVLTAMALGARAGDRLAHELTDGDL